jgi:hypothetical protein
MAAAPIPGAGGAGAASPLSTGIGLVADKLPNEGQFTKLGANLGPKGALVGAAADVTIGTLKAVTGAPKAIVDKFAGAMDSKGAEHTMNQTLSETQKGAVTSNIHHDGGPVQNKTAGKPVKAAAPAKNAAGNVIQMASLAKGNKIGAMKDGTRKDLAKQPDHGQSHGMGMAA